MTVILSASVVILGALVFLLLGAQVEMYRTIEQLREHSGLIDQSVPIALSRVGSRPSSVGLPESLDSTVSGVVLLLSDKCSTCRSIAASLDGALPRDLVLVVEPDQPGEPSDLTTSYQLDPERTIIDPHRRISDGLGINTTPVAVVIENGRLVRASTVPSSRRLHGLLDSVRAFETFEVGGAPTRY
ncbi:MAG: hypothetical protein ACRDTT_32020 [Pseudonocardiaceae bacterium]